MTLLCNQAHSWQATMHLLQYLETHNLDNWRLLQHFLHARRSWYEWINHGCFSAMLSRATKTIPLLINMHSCWKKISAGWQPEKTFSLIDGRIHPLYSFSHCYIWLVYLSAGNSAKWTFWQARKWCIHNLLKKIRNRFIKSSRNPILQSTLLCDLRLH